MKFFGKEFDFEDFVKSPYSMQFNMKQQIEIGITTQKHVDHILIYMIDIKEKMQVIKYEDLPDVQVATDHFSLLKNVLVAIRSDVQIFDQFAVFEHDFVQTHLRFEN